MKKVKFGIIGAGMIANFHAQAIQHSNNAELFAVFDTNFERAQAFALQYNIKSYSDFSAFLQDKNIEAVTIATPSGLHGQAAIAAMQAKKHVLCEKPLEINLTKADAMIQAAHENKVILSTVFQMRFSKSVAILKRALAEKKFGEVIFINGFVHWYRKPEYYLGASWRGTWALDGGGALMNQGIHTADLMLYLGGDVDEVFARSGNFLHKKIEVEDSICAFLHFKNGVSGTLQCSTACAPGFGKRIEIMGTCGSAVLEDDAIVRWEFLNETADDEVLNNHTDAESIKGGTSDPNAISFEGHLRQITDLAEAILNCGRISSTGEEGRRSVELITSIYKSVATGERICIK